jgi:hypothetical protein
MRWRTDDPATDDDDVGAPRAGHRPSRFAVGGLVSACGGGAAVAALTAHGQRTIACDHASEQACCLSSQGVMQRRGPRSSKTSKKDRIYRTLRQEVLTLALPPGAILVESALSHRYRAGRPTIREALALLQQDGLLIAMPRRGYLVAPITMDDVQELFELRLILESAVARLAVSRITSPSWTAWPPFPTLHTSWWSLAGSAGSSTATVSSTSAWPGPPVTSAWCAWSSGRSTI